MSEERIDFYKSVKALEYIVQKNDYTTRWIVGRLNVNIATNMYSLAINRDGRSLEAKELIEIGNFILDLNKDRKSNAGKIKQGGKWKIGTDGSIEKIQQKNGLKALKKKKKERTRMKKA